MRALRLHAALAIAAAASTVASPASRVRAACSTGSVEKFLQSIDGADVSEPDAYGFTCLHRAAANGHEAVFLEALGRGADPLAAAYETAGHRAGETPLHAAAVGGLASGVRELLRDARVDVNLAMPNGMTALHYASGLGHTATVEALLAAGAALSAANQYGSTALHLAATSGRGQVVELLLKHGADAGASNQYGNTALHAACGVANVEAARFLVAARPALATVANADGLTPLEYARSRAKEDQEVASHLSALEELLAPA